MSSDNVYVFLLYFCRDNNTIPSILVIFRSSIEVEEVPQIPDLILILTIKAMLYLERGILMLYLERRILMLYLEGGSMQCNMRQLTKLLHYYV